MLSCPGSVQMIEKEGEKEADDEEQQEKFSDSNSSHGKATSDQIQKVLDCLQPHIADPDVQGEYIEPEHMMTVLIFRSLCNVLYFILTSSSSPSIVSSSEGSPARQPLRRQSN